MSKLLEISAVTAARRETDASTAAAEAARRENVAKNQYAALCRWSSEIRPAIVSAARDVTTALGGRGTGDFLESGSYGEARVLRGQLATGEQMYVAFRLHL
jgi:hypothetical protein